MSKYIFSAVIFVALVGCSQTPPAAANRGEPGTAPPAPSPMANEDGTVGTPGTAAPMNP